jgi:DNA polymerase III sliding clamp (beta) subunit (PCNA family)
MNSQVKINRFELISILEMLLPATGGGICPQTNQMFKFDEDSVSATDGIISIDAWLKQPLAGFKFKVNTSLVGFLKGLSSDEVSVRCSDDSITVSSGKSRMKFVTALVGKTNDVNDSETPSVELQAPVSNKLVDGLISCCENVAAGDTAGVLGGVCINNGSVISTNRSRIFRYKMDDTGINCVVPTKFVKTISKYRDNASLVISKYGTLLKAVVDTEFAIVDIRTRLVSGNYPELESYIPSTDGVVVKFPEGFKKVILRHLMVIRGVGEEDRGTNIEIDGSTCTVKTVNKSVCEIEDVIDLCNSVETKIEFIINPALLIDVIGEYNEFQYYPDGKFVLFQSGNVVYLVQTRE